MTEKNNSDDEAQTSTNTQSRFAKFESPHNVDSKESTDDGDDNDEDDSLLSEGETGADSDSDSDSVTNIDTDTDTSTSDSKEQATSDSRSSRLWSDAAITDTTDNNSDTPETTSLSSDNSENRSDNTSDATVSVDSTQHSSDPATDKSGRDSDRIWNQPSRSDSTEETSTTGNQGNDNSVNIDQTDISEEIPTDNNQNNENSVNTGQIDSSVAPQSQSQPQSQAPSSLDNVSAGSVQTDNNAITDGSQALLLGEDNPKTWNTGFTHILEPQQPQNLLLLVPAGETVDILRVCQEHPNWDGGEIIIIKAGASVPGDMSVAELSGDGMEESIETHQISDQTDLSRLGILITQVLNNWQKPDQKTVCSVYTLQAFLQYLSPQKVFQFLYTLSRRLQSADIETTYLMTPSDGDRTINTLRPIFDTVIEK